MEWWEIIHKDPLYPLPSYSNDNISHNYGMYHNEENEFDITYIPYLEKEMATHSSILTWRNPWTEEPGGLLSRGSHRVGHDWSDSSSSSCIHPMHFTTVVHMGVQFCVIWSYVWICMSTTRHRDASMVSSQVPCTTFSQTWPPPSYLFPP